MILNRKVNKNPTAFNKKSIDQETYTSQCLCWYPLQYKFPLSPRIYALREGKVGISEAVRLYIQVIGPLLFMTLVRAPLVT